MNIIDYVFVEAVGFCGVLGIVETVQFKCGGKILEELGLDYSSGFLVSCFVKSSWVVFTNDVIKKITPTGQQSFNYTEGKN